MSKTLRRVDCSTVALTIIGIIFVSKAIQNTTTMSLLAVANVVFGFAFKFLADKHELSKHTRVLVTTIYLAITLLIWLVII